MGKFKGFVLPIVGFFVSKVYEKVVGHFFKDVLFIGCHVVFPSSDGFLVDGFTDFDVLKVFGVFFMFVKFKEVF